MKTRRQCWRWLLLLPVCAALAGLRPVQALPLNLSTDLARLVAGGGGGSVRVIVQSVGQPTDLLLQTVALLGGGVYARFGAITGFAATLPLVSVPVLAGRGDVERISLDLPVLGALDLSSAAVGATSVRENSGLDGAGIGVALLDTGVAPHRDLTYPTSRLTGWTDLVNGRSAPYDDSGHGTHVAGIAAGNGAAAASAGRELRGMAPGALIIGVKVLDANMQGCSSNVIRGIDFVIQQRKRLNIRVANLSLGQPVRESYRNEPLCRAVAQLWKTGVVVVVSAGNLGRIDPRDPNSGVRYGSITSPANHPLVITVGATRTNFTAVRSDDEIATYSSRGPTLVDHVLKPDLVAPGNRVWSLGAAGVLAAKYPEQCATVGGARYHLMSGTSMAAPTVAGAIAVLLQAKPALSPDSVKVRLMHSASKRWNSAVAYNPYSRGAGLLDLPAALRQPEEAGGWARSPLVFRSSSPGEHRVEGGDALWGNVQWWNGRTLWSDRSLWGDQVTWGDDGASDNTDPQILWGEPTLWGDQVTWGDDGASDNTDPQILWGEPTACWD